MRFQWASAAALLWLAGCQADLGLEEPRHYACSRDGGPDCPPQLVCGLEGYCHAPDEPFPFRCLSDGDCASGWRCGQAQSCQPREVGGPYACADDSHCEAGWHCGLEGSCLDPAVGEPSPCASDLHCGGGWRCAPAGTCVDPALDALRPEATAGALTLQRLHPLILDRLPERVASGPQVAEGDYSHALAFVSGGQLVHLQHSPQGLWVTDGGVPVLADLRTVALPGPVIDLATTETDSFLLHAGGVDRLGWDPSDPPYQSALTPLTGNRLRVVSGTPRTGVVLTDQSYALFSLDTGVSSGPFRLDRADGGTQRILDLLELPKANWHPDALLAATEEGLMMAVDGGFRVGGPQGVWAPVDLQLLPSARCPVSAATYDGGYRALSLHPGLRALGVTAAPWNAGAGAAPTHLMVYSKNDHPAGACPAPYPLGGGALWGLIVGPCQLCPDGESLVQVQWVYAGAYYIPEASSGAQVHCRRGTEDRIYRLESINVQPSQCRRIPVTGEGTLGSDAVLDQFSGSGQFSPRAEVGYDHGRAAAGAHGQLWHHSAQEESLTPTTAAQVLAAPGGVLTTSGFAFQPGIGFVRSWDDPAGGLSSRPDWWASLDQGVSLRQGLEGRLLAVGDGSSSFFAERVIATLSPLPDGAELFVAGKGEALFSAILRGWDQPGYVPPTVVLRDTPRPGSPILSVAVAPASSSPDAPLARGYVLTRDALLEFTAEVEAVWRSQEISAPPGDWLKVWFDGTRGRLGYADGRVYSLPSRVLLAPPLPGNQAADFGQLCGQPFALGGSGLYRLLPDSDGDGVGQWQVEPVDAWLPPHPDRGLARGRLHQLEDSLYLFTQYGSAVRLGAQCPGGAP